MSQWEMHARSESGNVRDRNEDRYMLDEDRGLVALADGMGGREKGNVASELFVETLQSEAQALSKFARSGDPVGDAEHREEILQRLKTVVQQANRTIFNNGGRGRMGTTGEAALLHRGAASIAHVGDSRIYLVQNGTLRQLTDDHTYADMIGDEALEESDDMELGDVLTRAVGTKPHVSVDTLFVELEPGDRLLLCSDGITRHLEDPEIGDIARDRPSEEVADILVDRSLSAGGLDNATAVAVEVADDPGDTFDSTDTVNTLEKAELLHHIDLFEGLDDRRILQLIRYLVTVEFAEGEPLIEEGSEHGGMYVILSGTVSVRREDRSITHLGPGDHVGEMALAELGRRTADVVAEEPVRALELAPNEFEKLVESDPQTGSLVLQNLFETSVRRLRETTDQLLLSQPSPSEG